MPASPTISPRRRAELIVRPAPEEGSFVIKDPANRSYFKLGEQEFFLLERLDGVRTTDRIAEEFTERFGEPISPDDVNDFVGMARDQNLLEIASKVKKKPPPLNMRARKMLYWRRRVLDPDAILNWLEPRTRFLYTYTFFILSFAAILWAGVLAFTNAAEFIRFIPRTWETLILVWLTVGTVTAIHEFAHGLTCKHYGGEVHEMGFMMMFLMPCFYCDISDAWLFKGKWERLWVTAAGTYSDLCIWAVAMIVWRLTLPETLPGAIASVVVSVCGLRVFFNAIPLLKLDGYYFVSDLFEVPNLRNRSLNRLADWIRCLLWGGRRPEPDPQGRTLLAVGIMTFSFSFWFLTLSLYSLWYHWVHKWGWPGLAGVLFMGWMSTSTLFRNFSKGEVMKMFLYRRLRLLAWLVILTGAGLALAFVPMQETAHGSFQVRPSSRAEIRAPIAGFLRTIHHVEGDKVDASTVIAQIEVIDLATKIQEKRSEIAEATAKLKLLEIGPRKEEVDEQRLKVERARHWKELSQQDLGRKRGAFEQEVLRLRETVRLHNVEAANCRENFELAQKLFASRSLSQDQVREWEKKTLIAESMVRQAEAALRERQTTGVQEQESELAKREKEYADARATLGLLEIGTRPEEIDAQRSLVGRLTENLQFLESLGNKLSVSSSISGVITTPHLKEKIGSYLKEGELICEVEDSSDLEVEIPLLEQEVARVKIDQPVTLKARALPFESIEGRVHRIAPTVGKAEKPGGEGSSPAISQHTITVYCRLNESCPELHPGMTGHARICCGEGSAGSVLWQRVLRYLRTEFWW